MSISSFKTFISVENDNFVNEHLEKLNTSEHEVETHDVAIKNDKDHIELSEVKDQPLVNYNSIPKVDSFVLASREGFISTVSDYFISFFKKIGTFFYNPNPDKYQIETDNFIEESISVFKKNRNKLAKVDFVSIAHVDTAYNMLMKVDVYTAANILFPVARDLTTSIIPVLDELDTRLARYVANQDLLKNLQPNKRDTNIIKFLKNGEDIMSQLLDNNGRKDTRPLSKVIPNVECVTQTVDKLMDIRDLKMYKTSIELNKLSKRIYENINKLILVLNKADFKISKQALADLIEELELSAKLVTMYGNILYVISLTAIGLTNGIYVMVDQKPYYTK